MIAVLVCVCVCGGGGYVILYTYMSEHCHDDTLCVHILMEVYVS